MVGPPLGYFEYALTFTYKALASLPFGALRKAQRELARASALGALDEDSESEEDDSEAEEVSSRYSAKGKGREVEEPPKPKKEIPKRPHKHAYGHTYPYDIHCSLMGC